MNGSHGEKSDTANRNLPVSGLAKRKTQKSKKGPKKKSSLFETVLSQKFTATVDGKTRQVTLKEALVHKMKDRALAGDFRMTKEMLALFEKIAAKRAYQEPEPVTPIKRTIINPYVCYEALKCLGIIEEDQHGRRKIAPWVAEAARTRNTAPSLSEDGASAGN
jgi:hypothetical protein